MTGSNIHLCMPPCRYQIISLHMGFPSTQIPKKVPSLSLTIWIPPTYRECMAGTKVTVSPLWKPPSQTSGTSARPSPHNMFYDGKRETYYWLTYITSLFLLLIVILLSDLDIANWSRNNSSQHFKCKKCQVSKPQI